jgi:F0F1-type ATP synthase assembly protein I
MPWWVLALRLSGLGFYIALCIVGGIVAGVLVDRALGSKVIFLLVGLMLGCVSAFYGTYKMVSPLLDSNEGSTGGSNGGDEPKSGREG